MKSLTKIEKWGKNNEIRKNSKTRLLKSSSCNDCRARTIEDVKVMTDLDTVEYENDIKAILASICGCKGTSLEQVVTLATEWKTVEEIKEITGTATACGRCIHLLEAVVAAKK